MSGAASEPGLRVLLERIYQPESKIYLRGSGRGDFRGGWGGGGEEASFLTFYPSLKSTLTLTSQLGQNCELGRGR